MADPNSTKRLFAATLKEQMTRLPFSRIGVTDLCAGCGMNRKSFYYHFKDKYDLVNWSFDTEFAAFAGQRIFTDEWELLEQLCMFFYANRDFYRKVWQIEGQNCFAEHFHEFFQARVEEYLKPACPEKEERRLQATLLADAVSCAIGRWIAEKEPAPPRQFLERLCACAQVAAGRSYGRRTAVCCFADVR